MHSHYIPDHEFPLSVSPRITLLGNYYINLFLIRGDKASAIFEMGISGVTDAVISQLETLGVRPEYLIMSHPHADHATGLPGLMARFPSATVIAADGAAQFLAHPKASLQMIREDAFMSRELSRLGFTPGRPPVEQVPDIRAARIISRETTLDLGGVTLELFPVAGHSPGNILARSGEALFCSDSLGFHFPGRNLFWPLFFTGLNPYLETLDRISRMPLSLLCPAHQGPIRGSEAVSDAIHRSRETVRELVQRVARTPGEDDSLVRQFFEESYRDEFTLYTPENITNCSRLLLKRARETADA
jgi:2-aminobenzoylacetyl-CoA thioesterase